MQRKLGLTVLLLIVGCMPQGGPSPNAVLVIRSADYPIDHVLEALNALKPVIDDQIDKKSEHSYYEAAYWYPYKGSEIYGVGLAKWPSDLKGNGAEDMKDRYFVEVYAADEACSLCKSVKASLEKHRVSFFSACEQPMVSTSYERIRCGT